MNSSCNPADDLALVAASQKLQGSERSERKRERECVWGGRETRSLQQERGDAEETVSKRKKRERGRR